MANWLFIILIRIIISYLITQAYWFRKPQGPVQLPSHPCPAHEQGGDPDDGRKGGGRWSFKLYYPCTIGYHGSEPKTPRTI